MGERERVCSLSVQLCAVWERGLLWARPATSLDKRLASLLGNNKADGWINQSHTLIFWRRIKLIHTCLCRQELGNCDAILLNHHGILSYLWLTFFFFYSSVWHWVYLNSLMQLPLILSICTDVTYRCPVILYLFLDSLNCLPVRSMSSFTSIPPAVPVQAAGDAEGDERAAC